jgi:hypothetical protein
LSASIQRGCKDLSCKEKILQSPGETNDRAATSLADKVLLTMPLCSVCVGAWRLSLLRPLFIELTWWDYVEIGGR